LESESLTHGLSKLILAGFDIKEEPYLRGVLTCMRLHILQVSTAPSIPHRPAISASLDFIPLDGS
jgi:hypothetical protein